MGKVICQIWWPVFPIRGFVRDSVPAVKSLPLRHYLEMNTKDKARARRLWDNYKLTVDQYDKILAFQGGVCWACHQPEPVKGRRLSVDHCHITGIVRGLLCSRCNPVLGKIERAFIRYGLGKVCGIPEWIRRIAGYTAQNPATTALGHVHVAYKGRVGTKAHRRRIRKERKSLSLEQQVPRL